MIFAALLLAAAILLTFLSVARTRVLANAFEKKRSQRLELLDLKARLAHEQSALAVFNALPDPRPLDPLRLAADALDGATPKHRELGFTRLSGGWTARQIELTWAEIQLAKTWQFLVRAESNCPPWRLIEFRFIADPKHIGAGCLTVVLEAIEKSQ